MARPKRFLRSALRIALGLLVVGLAAFFTVVPWYTQRARNAVRATPPYQVSEQAQAVHDGLMVADLHADSLLWRRDLAARNEIGHVDLPRLLEARVGFQVFSVVTHTPRGQNYQSNTDDTDNITLLAIAQGWPVDTWGDRLARARYQAAKLRAFADASGGQLTLVGTRQELQDLLALRAQDPRHVGAFLALEGGHALEGDAANVDVLFRDGFRMMAPTHFFDNDLGGSAQGAEKGGLTALGRQVMARQEALGILVDIAHASPAVIDDVLAAATRPVVLSHGGVQGTCDNPRNLSDAHLRGIAATGGLVGIGLWETAVCGTDAATTARAMRYTADLIGVAHVALGSDFDGAVLTPFDVTGLPLLTEALLAQGFTREEIALIMGGNFLRLLLETLPEG